MFFFQFLDFFCSSSFLFVSRQNISFRDRGLIQGRSSDEGTRTTPPPPLQLREYLFIVWRFDVFLICKKASRH